MEHNLPVLKRCCFCISLRVGVIIAGYYSIFSKLGFIWMTIDKMSSISPETTKLLARTYMFYTLQIIVTLVYIVLSIMLLIGVQKKKPEYLRHFFVSSLVFIVVDLVVMSVAIIYFRNWMSSLIFLWIATNFYLLLVVRSSYLHMEEKERPDPRRRERDSEVCWDTMQLA